MIKIAVCDDNERELEEILSILNEYHSCSKISVTPINEPVDLIEQLENGEIFDIYILDMIMPQLNGIEVGKYIRENTFEKVIIYLTMSKEYALDAYSVLAQRYLLKPVKKEEIYEALDCALKYVNAKDERFYSLKTKDGIVNISYSDIVYIVKNGRVMSFFLENGIVIDSVQTREPFEQLLYDLISCYDFVQPHKSYVVNMHYIQKLMSNQILLKTLEEIPISRGNGSKAKNKYLKYLAQKEC